jgi:predicted nuclease with TOPRIM domain
MSNTSPVFSQMDSFEDKAYRLVEMVNAGRQRILELESEKSVLEREKAKLAGEVTKQQNQLRQLEKMVNNSPKEFSKPTNIPKIVNNKHNDAETTAELKQQLTAYIEELDRCIAYLSDLS